MLHPEVARYLERAKRFEVDAIKLFTTHERSPHRVVTLSSSALRIGRVNEKQRELLSQASRCIELGIFRAAYVTAWLALIDQLQELAARDGFAAINAARPKWTVSSIDSLREGFTEYAQIDAMQAAGLVTKSQGKSLHGMLNDRNRCAHPDDFAPDLNTSLGYLANVLSLMEIIQSKL